MAEVTEALPPSEIVERMPSKGGRLYPWDDWFDGQIHKLTRGKHYHCQDSTMANAARAAGRRREFDVDASYNAETGHVWVHKIGPLTPDSPAE